MNNTLNHRSYTYWKYIILFEAVRKFFSGISLIELMAFLDRFSARSCVGGRISRWTGCTWSFFRFILLHYEACYYLHCRFSFQFSCQQDQYDHPSSHHTALSSHFKPKHRSKPPPLFSRSNGCSTLVIHSSPCLAFLTTSSSSRSSVNVYSCSNHHWSLTTCFVSRHHHTQNDLRQTNQNFYLIS